MNAALVQPSTARLSFPRFLQRHRRAVSGGAAIVVFLVIWQSLAVFNVVATDLLAPPTDVVAAAISLSTTGNLGKNALITLLEFVEGFVPAVAAGLALGLLLSFSRRLRLLCGPLLMALYTVPRIALIPIVVIWFGIETQSKAIIVFLSAVFPVLINTMAGVEGVDSIWVRAVRAFGGTRWQVIRKVVLPGALPAIMAGIRLGVGRGLLSVIVAELYVSLGGLGHMLQSLTATPGKTPQVFAIAFIVTFGGFALVAGLRALEERVGAWRISTS